MGITLPRGTGWMSFIYNAGQHEELLSAVPEEFSLPKVVTFWFQHCRALGLVTEMSGL